MMTITIIAVIVVALITILISAFLLLAYREIIKSYKLEVDLGKHDKEIIEEQEENNKKETKRVTVFVNIISTTILALVLGLFITSTVYSVNSDMSMGNSLVIGSGSMSEFYSDEYEEDLKQKFPEKTSFEHFQTGDICFFDKKFDLVPGNVYAYKHIETKNGKTKEKIIVHRLIEIVEVGNDSYKFKFQGDNERTHDKFVYNSEYIIGQYNGHRIKGIGSFVLYYQSGFGLYSLFCVILVYALFEYGMCQYQKINKDRLESTGGLVRLKEED